MATTVSPLGLAAPSHCGDPLRRPPNGPATGAFNAHLSFTSARSSGDREKLRNKLVDVGQRFVGFDKILEEETVKRKQTETSRVAGVQDGLLKLESALNSEIKRRVDANKQVQVYTENLANSMLDRLQSTILQRIEKIASSLDSLSLRTSALEKGISQFRGELPSKLQVDTAALVKEISHLRTHMEQEQHKRIEGDTALLKRVAEIEATESRRFDECLEALHQECEVLRNEVENFARTEDGNGARVEQFHTFILEEIAGMKNTLSATAHAREQTDDEIVQAMTQYTNALHKGLQAANKR